VVLVGGQHACKAMPFSLKVDNTKPRLLLLHTWRASGGDELELRVSELSSMAIVGAHVGHQGRYRSRREGRSAACSRAPSRRHGSSSATAQATPSCASSSGDLLRASTRPGRRGALELRERPDDEAVAAKKRTTGPLT
jgi:hypothetical protein